MSESISPLDLLKNLQQEVTRLSNRRDQLVRQLAEVDAEIAAAANAFGVATERPPEAGAAPALPGQDRRRAGSMVEFAIQVIADSDDGITRSDLKQAIFAHSKFGPKLSSNPTHFYNFTKRLIDRREIEDKFGRLWLRGKAPEEQPISNSATLFEGGGNA